MPRLLLKYGYRFHFYAGDRAEPPHVHVDGHGGSAKFWLESVELVRSDGIPRRDLIRIREAVEEHRTGMLEVWREFMGRR